MLIDDFGSWPVGGFLTGGDLWSLFNPIRFSVGIGGVGAPTGVGGHDPGIGEDGAKFHES